MPEIADVPTAKIRDLPIASGLADTAIEIDQYGDPPLSLKVPAVLAAIGAHSFILSRSLATPPVSPAEFDRYIVAASGTGAWAGQDGNIAEWLLDGSGNGAWYFSPSNGLNYVADEGITIKAVAGTLSILTTPPTPQSVTDLSFAPSNVSYNRVIDGVGNHAAATVTVGQKWITTDALYPDGNGGFLAVNVLALCIATSPEAWVALTTPQGSRVISKADFIERTFNGTVWQPISGSAAAARTPANVAIMDAACATLGVPWYLDASFSLTANTVYTAKKIFGLGGIITRGAYTLSGKFWAAPDVAMFENAGTGAITIPHCSDFQATWYSMALDGASDDSAPIQAALLSASLIVGSARVLLPATLILCNVAHAYAGVVIVGTGLTTGASLANTRVQAYDGTKWVFDIGTTSANINAVGLIGVTVHGASVAEYGVRITCCDYSEWSFSSRAFTVQSMLCRSASGHGSSYSVWRKCVWTTASAVNAVAATFQSNGGYLTDYTFYGCQAASSAQSGNLCAVYDTSGGGQIAFFDFGSWFQAAGTGNGVSIPASSAKIRGYGSTIDSPTSTDLLLVMGFNDTLGDVMPGWLIDGEYQMLSGTSGAQASRPFSIYQEVLSSASVAGNLNFNYGADHSQDGTLNSKCFIQQNSDASLQISSAGNSGSAKIALTPGNGISQLEYAGAGSFNVKNTSNSNTIQFAQTTAGDAMIVPITGQYVSARGPLELTSAGPRFIVGTGSPEGAVTAPANSVFLRTDGSGAARNYLKVSGSGNTGWVPILVQYAPGLVSALPAASVGAGMRGFVTDATTPVFGATVVGSGAVAVPVVSNGTNWIVG